MLHKTAWEVLLKENDENSFFYTFELGINLDLPVQSDGKFALASGDNQLYTIHFLYGSFIASFTNAESEILWVIKKQWPRISPETMIIDYRVIAFNVFSNYCYS